MPLNITKLKKDMILNFFWHSVDTTVKAMCTVRDVDEKTTNCIVGLLTDDGCLSKEENLLWLNKGVRAYKDIVTLDKQDIYWDRDAWVSYYLDEKVKIYSLYDDNYYRYLDLNVFNKF